jgi:hypothetical protein
MSQAKERGRVDAFVEAWMLLRAPLRRHRHVRSPDGIKCSAGILKKEDLDAGEAGKELFHCQRSVAGVQEGD